MNNRPKKFLWEGGGGKKSDSKLREKAQECWETFDQISLSYFEIPSRQESPGLKE